MIRKQKIIFISVFLILLTGAAGLFLYHRTFAFIHQPNKPGSAGIILTIPPGQGLRLISENLENQGLVSSGLYFFVYAKFKKSGNRLQAGEYELSASQSPKEILDLLTRGKVRTYRLTFPEGLTVRDIAVLAETDGLCNKERFIALCHDPDFIRTLGITALSLEGYLFPDTYFFSRKNTCEDMIVSMVRRFWSVFRPEWQERAGEINLSLHEIVTLASIIEKETGDPSERPLIASVFHNRLQKGMRLESDPTVVYGIPDFDGIIRRSHLQADTPYNTYRIPGLPPGPIASPGALSLEAALYPASTGYLFFVSKNDRTHHFSTRYEEHRRAVNQYQRGR